MEALARTPAADGGSSDDTWDAPDLRLLVRQKGEQPPFPVEVLPAFWRGWCREAAAGTGAPVDYVALALLTAGAGLIGAGRHVSPVPAWVEPCVLWTALAGPSGSGKTRAMQAALRLVRALDRELADDSRVQARLDVGDPTASSAPLPGRLPVARAPKPVTHRQLITHDPTIDAVAEALKVNTRGVLLACDPLVDWLAGMARRESGSAHRSCWQSSWSAGLWTVTRRGRRSFWLASAAVSILGTVEPGTITTALASDEDIGSRLLFAWPCTMPLAPLSDAPAAPCLEALRALRRLRDLPGKPRVVRLSTAAHNAFDDFRRAHASTGPVLDDVEAAWWGRGPNTVLRLAGVLTFLDWAASLRRRVEPAVVPVAALKAAAELWRGYLCRHAGAVLGALGSSDGGRQAQEALLWIQGRQLAEVSREDIPRHAGTAPDAAGADGIIETLVAARWLRPLDPERPGAQRSRRRWAVNPFLTGVANAAGWPTVPAGVLSGNAADPPAAQGPIGAE